LSSLGSCRATLVTLSLLKVAFLQTSVRAPGLPLEQLNAKLITGIAAPRNIQGRLLALLIPGSKPGRFNNNEILRPSYAH